MGYPAKILLATDLSARSDRAQDRAFSLMRQYDSELIVLHVLESLNKDNSIKRIPFLPFYDLNQKAIQKVRHRLIEDMNEYKARASVLIEEGEPYKVIIRVAKEQDCDLIITGTARNEILGRFTLGKTVDRLLEKSEKSLLIVTEKVKKPYGKIVVITDLSEISKNAIKTAATLFPDKTLIVVYAYSAPKSSAVDNREGYIEQMRLVAHRDLTHFLDTIEMGPDQRARFNKVIEHDSEVNLARKVVQLYDAELLVVGSRLRGIVSHFIFGTRAKRAISSLSCDALVVRSNI